MRCWGFRILKSNITSVASIYNWWMQIFDIITVSKAYRYNNLRTFVREFIRLLEVWWFAWQMCEFLKIKPCAVSEAGNAYSECRRREVCNRKIKKDSLEFQPNLSKMSLLYQPDGFILYKRHRRAVKITQTLLPQGENFSSEWNERLHKWNGA